MQFIMLALLFLSAVANADDKLYGKGYKLGSNRKDLLFLYEWVSTPTPGRRTEVATYKTPDQKEILVVEEATFKVDANKKETLEAYKIEQRQIASVGTVVNGPEMRVYKYVVDGKLQKKGEEKMVENFVVSSTLIAYLTDHWEDIKSGKKVIVEYGVMDRARSVDFKLFKESVNSDGHVIVKMVGDSIFVRALVDPLYFEFSADGQTLHSMKGRTEPKVRVGSSFEEIEAEVLYSPTK